jgi:hypothetical protein
MERILEQEYFNKTGKKAFETLKTGKRDKIIYTTPYKKWLANKEGRKYKLRLLKGE